MPGESSKNSENLSSKERFERDFPDFVCYSNKIKIPRDRQGSINYDALYKATEDYLYNGIDASLVELFKTVRRGEFSNDEAFYNEIYNNLSKKDHNNALCHLFVFRHHQPLFEYIYLQKEREIEKNKSDKVGQSRLHWAAMCNQSSDKLKQIIQEDVKVNHLANGGSTALHLAAQYSHAETAEVLIECGAEVNETTNNGWAALHFAAQNGYVKVVEILIKHDANVNQTTYGDLTALHIAAQNGHVKVVEVLIARGAEVNQTHKEGWTALHMAAQNGRAEVVKVLIEQGAKVNQATKEGGIALHYAARNGHVEVAKILIEQGAKVDQTEKSGGWTALHFAASCGHLEVFKVLLSHGAAINQKTNGKNTALSLAIKHGHYHIAYACLGAMYKVKNSSDRQRLRNELRYPYHNYPYLKLIHLFLQHKKYDTLQYMLENYLNLPPNFDLYLENFNGDSLVDIIKQQYSWYTGWLQRQQSQLPSKTRFIAKSEENYRRDFPDHEVYQDEISKGKNEDQSNMDYTDLFQVTEDYLYKNVNKTLVTLLKIIRRGDFSDDTLKKHGFMTRVNFHSQVNDYLLDKDNSGTCILMLLQCCHDEALLNYIYQKRGNDVFEKYDLTKPSEPQSEVEGKGKAKLIQSPPVAIQGRDDDFSVILRRDQFGFNQFDQLLLLSDNPIEDIQTLIVKLNMATIKQTVDHNQFPSLPQGSLFDSDKKREVISNHYGTTIRSRRVSGIMEWVDLVHYNDRLDDSHRGEAAETIKQLIAIHLCFVPVLEYFAKAEDNQDIRKQWEHFNKNILNNLDKIRNKDDLSKIIDSFIKENNQRFTFLTMMKGDSYRSYMQVLQNLKEHYRTVFKKRGEELKELLGEEPTLSDTKRAWNALSSPQASVDVQDGAGSSSPVGNVPEGMKEELEKRQDEVFGL